MTVTAAYLKEHFDELIPATDDQEIDVQRDSDDSYRLQLLPNGPVKDRSRMWGALKGQIWIAHDFNSPEVSER